jgi:nitroreductase
MNASAADRADSLLQLASDRYSCRGFLPEPLPRATIDRILAIAQRSPSWCNSQPWQLTVGSAAATERARSALLAHVRQGAKPKPDLEWPREYRGVYLARRREGGSQLYAATGVARGDAAAGERQRLESFRFFGAPHVAILSTEEPLGTYGAIDWAPMWRRMPPRVPVAPRRSRWPRWRRSSSSAPAWGLDPRRPIVCGLAFGYEDPAHPANGCTSRALLNDPSSGSMNRALRQGARGLHQGHGSSGTSSLSAE